MARISNAQWARYKKDINNFHEDANQDILEMRQKLDYIPLNGDDESDLGPPIEFRCLFLYNYFRTWPIIGYTINGEVDKQSCVALINLDYLRRTYPELMTADSRLIYKPEGDIFTHRGDKYIATGDSFVSQAKDEPLLFMMILKRFINPPQSL